MSNFQTRRWRLTVKPPWPDDAGCSAVFETRNDAEAAGQLVRELYRGQGFKTTIEEIWGSWGDL